jgi:dTDP-glucose pyrophosphorylase
MINLIMPMAGRGSRFSKAGFHTPKPLVELENRPFFWWSVMSIIRNVEVASLICVVLKEHVEVFDIKNKICSFFPEAKFVVLDDVTDGALDTACQGVEIIDNDYPVVINDCDHAFEISHLSEYLKNIDEISGYLCHFKSSLPAYSYALYDNNYLVRTVEKEVISDMAIAGAYIFKNKNIIIKYYDEYKNNCEYNESYISGLYNLMVRGNEKIKGITLDSHISFGTPDELSKVIINIPYKSWIE